ncbi:phosphoribosylaminoimidazolesuccinocarboxamide synthase [Blastopirellula marina]|uniref:Phosphoribosylaminoimidazole-succinocarboxamide synthase n=1 Tax=Blastopirellula marina TaxID=124 RepID=A0A2S8F1Z2_9BACT|nr:MULTISPECIES: phosphoribosylaminoimidazolesuccinocarboxamide synthase [Pirellulaceae]PQO26163.1 phosphoribosylaminoimidazolesuccinocarboxamide synthase [Blastopirellula marina]RCS44522.1 phosphoribosylaminoimidazolesuccinocarboxamide synthase [Bremerella cremea]
MGLNYPVRQGKVRDVYDLGDQVLLVASDRISAFDYILPSLIPDKGRVLTQMSLFWFETLDIANHLISTDVQQMNLAGDVDLGELDGRSTLARKTEVIPIECVVRGYLAGSGWKEYQRSQTVCDIPLPAGLEQAAKLPEPIFTPATKAETGHDENISFERMVEIVGAEMANLLREKSIAVYQAGAQRALEHGIIIADTKFEWGVVNGEVLLIDEVLTPDSSRFWPQDEYAVGMSPPSFDKQFVRDWLEASTWDKNSEPPALPQEVIEKTRAKYIEAYERITQRKFTW